MVGYWLLTEIGRAVSVHAQSFLSIPNQNLIEFKSEFNRQILNSKIQRTSKTH